MSTLLLVIAISIAATFVCEYILWSIFYKKMAPLFFPHELDTSYFRFFSLPKLRAVAIVHSLSVALILTMLCIYLW